MRPTAPSVGASQALAEKLGSSNLRFLAVQPTMVTMAKQASVKDIQAYLKPAKS
jgi:hypothetical protein